MSKRKATSPVDMEMFNGDDDDNDLRLQTTPKRMVGVGTGRDRGDAMGPTPTSIVFAKTGPAMKKKSFEYITEKCVPQMEALNKCFLLNIQNMVKENSAAVLVPACESYLRHVVSLLVPHMSKKAGFSDSLTADKSIVGMAKVLDKFGMAMVGVRQSMEDNAEVEIIENGTRVCSGGIIKSKYMPTTTSMDRSTDHSPFTATKNSNLSSTVTKNSNPSFTAAKNSMEDRKISAVTPGGLDPVKEKPQVGDVFKNFKFGANSGTATPNTGFGFGLTKSPESSSSVPSLNTKLNGLSQGINQQNPNPSLSFFSFGQPAQPSTIQLPTTVSTIKNAESNEKDEDENEEPPKNVFVPVVEENSVYSIRVKLFAKGPDAFKDRGLGQLYVKELESKKFQIVIRADNNLGNILLNMIIPKNLPLTLKPKGILTCDPAGDKGKPLMILIKVKTDSDAKDLMDKLKEFADASS